MYIGDFDNIVTHLNNSSNDGDIIITMGAGDVYLVGENFLL